MNEELKKNLNDMRAKHLKEWFKIDTILIEEIEPITKRHKRELEEILKKHKVE